MLEYGFRQVCAEEAVEVVARECECERRDAGCIQSCAVCAQSEYCTKVLGQSGNRISFLRLENSLLGRSAKCTYSELVKVTVSKKNLRKRHGLLAE